MVEEINMEYSSIWLLVLSVAGGVALAVTIPLIETAEKVRLSSRRKKVNIKDPEYIK